ncbi:phage tail assembly protein [Citrobacter freundii]|uniref:phage tail assembly protein n=1 Tax=Citrobacter freundii TaxID=546 RepID=UPI00177DBC5F|nr:phage tail assembly protein [Citrobacter freundii]ELQ7794635.1 phage tail assembly protein [Citrobacter freundii]MBE0099035.1 phage tail assembly protein [Citrobacter freundii]MEA8857451.1 phage tail assembly protein [Citrobacter freundii]MEB1001351.1 phage tail assembly protein [Citrobacter freundii]
MKDDTANTEHTRPPKTEAIVILDNPLQRGNTSVTEVTVRKPNSGALRGTRLQALLDMDVESMMIVLPRVTTPALSKTEIMLMEPGDLLQLSVELVSFLLPKSVMLDSPQS